MIDDFAVFILSHGRPDNVLTLSTLRKCGYTGKVFIVIDNEDKAAKRYVDNFGDMVIVFDKLAVSKTFDEGDNFNDRRSPVYARNACFDIARRIGVTYFLELDDDYFNFCFKMDDQFGYVDSTSKTMILNADKIIGLLLGYYKAANFASLAVAQGGDYIGGVGNKFHSSLGQRRKVMNTFFCSTERPFQFIGVLNDDVNTYTKQGNSGLLFMTFPLVAIQQKMTQATTGGMTEKYIDDGTYIKSFYTVMYQPSSVWVSTIQDVHRRLHHHIDWATTVPCIIPEVFRKDSEA